MEYKHSYYHNTKEPLGLSVYSAGSQQCVTGQTWGPAVRDHYLLHYVSAGRGFYTCGGREYRLNAGDAFVIYPGELVSYHPDDREPWEYHWVGFVGAQAKELLRLCGFSKERPVRPLGSGTVAEDLRRIYAANGPSASAEAEMVGRLWLFFAHRIRENPLYRAGAKHTPRFPDERLLWAGSDQNPPDRPVRIPYLPESDFAAVPVPFLCLTAAGIFCAADFAAPPRQRDNRTAKDRRFRLCRTISAGVAYFLSKRPFSDARTRGSFSLRYNSTKDEFYHIFLKEKEIFDFLC